MTIRDSLGVPLEPDYDEPILKDVYGDDVYKNDTVYLNFEGIVLEKIWNVTQKSTWTN